MDSIGRGVRTSLPVAALVAVFIGLAAGAARAQDEPWDQGKHWVSVRAGFAKSTAEFAADGSYGFGFGYSWFLGRDLAWSATAGYDLLGKYGAAAEFEIPLTVEFSKHFRMGSSSAPYLGLGWGAIYHKTYRTGADESGFRQGLYLGTGANARINARSALGIDIRLMMEQDTRSINPTFPNGEASSMVLSAKISYSRVY